MTYEDLPGMRWSTLKHMARSAKHFRFAEKNERLTERTAQMLIGTAIHTFVLEPDRYSRRHPVYGKRRAGKDWVAFQENHGHTDEILSESETKQATHAGRAVLSHPIAQKYLGGEVERERVIQWTDEDTGVECKAKVDTVGDRLVELKSTTDATPRRFESTAARLAYHGQVAFYSDGMRANGFELAGPAAMVVVEQKPPHDVVVYRVPYEVEDWGRELYKAHLQRVVECRESGKYPGIAEEELELQLPIWAMDQDQDELTLDGARMELG